MKTIQAVDLFCGAGGASVALRRAAEARGLKLQLLAVNHWPIAVETHSLNHPGVRHLCGAVERINPRAVVPGGRLQLLIAAPECTHHSRARGGRPVNAQSRDMAWSVLKWAQELYVENILIENVVEFEEWGPVGANGKALKSGKGKTFRAFLEALRSLDYRVDVKKLCAADYGDPTTRVRLFVIARRGRRPIEWPAPTHSKSGGRTLFGSTARWRPARDVIDWTLPSRSIFGRKKPLSPKTMARIIAGLERFGGKGLQPFLVQLRGTDRSQIAASARSLDAPLSTVTASGAHHALCEPFVLVNNANNRPKGLDEPVPTVTGGDRLYLCGPFVLQQQSGGAPRSVDQPLPTIATDGAQALVEPFILPFLGERDGQAPRTRSIDEPLQTVTTSNPIGLVEPFLVHVTHGRDMARAHHLDKPLPTITTAHGGELALVEPFVASYYGTKNLSPVSAPLPTVTTKDRFALILSEVNGQVLDIRLRMLQPKELARAMSFDDSYQFAGTKGDQVKQIGNAWACRLGEALIGTLVDEYATARPARWREVATA